GRRPLVGLDRADAAAVAELGDDQHVLVLVPAGEVHVAAGCRTAGVALQQPDADVVGAVVLVLLHAEVDDVVARLVGTGVVGRRVAVHDVDLAVDVVVVVALPATVADPQRVLAAGRVGGVVTGAEGRRRAVERARSS